MRQIIKLQLLRIQCKSLSKKNEEKMSAFLQKPNQMEYYQIYYFVYNIALSEGGGSIFKSCNQI